MGPSKASETFRGIVRSMLPDRTDSSALIQSTHPATGSALERESALAEIGPAQTRSDTSAWQCNRRSEARWQSGSGRTSARLYVLRFPVFRRDRSLPIPLQKVDLVLESLRLLEELGNHRIFPGRERAPFTLDCLDDVARQFLQRRTL